MKDYSKGKIYKIIDESNGDVYIGSTIQSLKRRFHTHQIFKDYNKLKCNCKIILIEDYPCNSRRELEKREQYFIDNTDCINKLNSYLTPEEHMKMKLHCANRWRNNNRERVNECRRKIKRYQETWGGRIDKYYNNSLLKIDVNLFL